LGLKEDLLKVWTRHPSYGHKRLALELKINHKRVRRVMRIFGLKPPRRKLNFYTTRSTDYHNYSNLIKGLLPSKINQLWCSDLSYIKFQGRFWYLATIEDIFTRQIVGASIGKYHNSELVLTTVKQAISNTKQIPDIFHSDQGTEFMAKVCTDYLEDKGTRISVSAKASPWQNGYQESFFGKFKDEIGDLNRFETVGQLIEAIYQQIHYYNNLRIHTVLKMPPAVYAKQFS
jgi:transposase InsO family protein